MLRIPAADSTLEARKTDSNKAQEENKAALLPEECMDVIVVVVVVWGKWDISPGKTLRYIYTPHQDQ